MVPKKADAASVRSQVVTVRLDPKLKYLADLAARKQRRTLSSYIEWAVERSLDIVHLEEPDSWNNGSSVSVMDAERSNKLWDVDEADRLARLGASYPELLTHEEQVLWKLIRECGYLWRGNYKGPDGEWTWKVDLSNLIWDRLRDKWEVFNDVAHGKAPLSTLPSWVKSKPAVTDSGGWDDAPAPSGKKKSDNDFDDIPF